MRGTRALAVAAVAAVAASACGFLAPADVTADPGFEPVGPRIGLGAVPTFGSDDQIEMVAQATQDGGWCYSRPNRGRSCTSGEPAFGPAGTSGWGASSVGDRTCFDVEAEASVLRIRIETPGQTVTVPPLERSLEVLGQHLFAACFAREMHREDVTLTAIHDDGSEHPL